VMAMYGFLPSSTELWLVTLGKSVSVKDLR
jgi:hypothetical protein